MRAVPVLRCFAMMCCVMLDRAMLLLCCVDGCVLLLFLGCFCLVLLCVAVVVPAWHVGVCLMCLRDDVLCLACVPCCSFMLSSVLAVCYVLLCDDDMFPSRRAVFLRCMYVLLGYMLMIIDCDGCFVRLCFALRSLLFRD